ITRGLLVEKNDQLAHRYTIFRPTKTEYIYTRFPSDRFRRAAKRCDGIGKARTVHMKQQSVRPREGANRLKFIWRINRSELRRLGNANSVHHVLMELHLLRDEFFCLAQADFSVVVFRENQFRAPCIKLRSAGFVGLDMGALMTAHAVKRFANLSEAERVCPG